MRVQLPYGRSFLDVDLPDDATVLQPATLAPIADPRSAVRHALDAPTAGPPLPARLRGGRSVVIVISDVTRPVPSQTLLPPIIEVLHEAGIEDEAITILNGTGLHRPNTPAE